MVINRPGKFEGEPAYVPYFWEQSLEGTFDEIDEGNGVIVYASITDDDIAIFPELTDSRGQYIALAESEQGFVYWSILSKHEIEALEDYADENDETAKEEEETESDDSEPDEDSITTEDHIHFYQYGKLVFTLDEDEDTNVGIKRELDRMQFWPNVFWLSDHGNAHLIEYWNVEVTERR